MKNLRAYIQTLITCCLLCVAAQGAYAAGEYYRWVGEDGVMHYGSRPPQGVKAERINTYGRAQAENLPTQGAAEESQEAQESSPEDVVAMREQQCTDERRRLQSLRTPGTRIRMEQPDGTIRYLTPEEVAREINSSEEFLSQACQKQ